MPHDSTDDFSRIFNCISKKTTKLELCKKKSDVYLAFWHVGTLNIHIYFLWTRSNQQIFFSAQSVSLMLIYLLVSLKDPIFSPIPSLMVSFIQLVKAAQCFVALKISVSGLRRLKFFSCPFEPKKLLSVKTRIEVGNTYCMITYTYNFSRRPAGSLKLKQFS